MEKKSCCRRFIKILKLQRKIIIILIIIGSKRMTKIKIPRAKKKSSLVFLWAKSGIIVIFFYRALRTRAPHFLFFFFYWCDRHADGARKSISIYTCKKKKKRISRLTCARLEKISLIAPSVLSGFTRITVTKVLFSNFWLQVFFFF